MHIEPINLAEDLFYTPTDEGTILIFAPLRSISLEVTPEEFQPVRNAMVDNDFTMKPEVSLAQRLYDGGFLPVEVETAWGFRPVVRKWAVPQLPELGEFEETQINSVVLNLTSVCNLGCSYCHSNVDGRNVKMPKDILDGALLILKRTALATGKSVSVSLLGEGENLVAPDLVRHVCERVVDMRAEGIKISLGVVTNATLITDENMAWMAAAVNNFSVSWDGDRAAMDAQRTTKGGGSVFDRMMESFEVMRRHQVLFSLRMTVTAQTVDRLPEFIQLAADEIYKDTRRGRSILIEPQTAMGKGDEIHQPDVALFNQRFWEAKELGKKLNIKVESGTVHQGARMTYCGAALPMVVVAPDGNITACSRVSKVTDPTWGYFHFGGFSPLDQKFNFNLDQIKKFRALQPDNFEDCRTCFYKHHCVGGCYALREEGKHSFPCELSKVMGREHFIRSHRERVAKAAEKSSKKV